MHVYILSHYLSISRGRTRFFQVNLKLVSFDSSTSTRNDTYLLTLQANCATILSDEETHNADTTTAD